jgi:hypothetical protein
MALLVALVVILALSDDVAAFLAPATRWLLGASKDGGRDGERGHCRKNETHLSFSSRRFYPTETPIKRGATPPERARRRPG